MQSIPEELTQRLHQFRTVLSSLKTNRLGNRQYGPKLRESLTDFSESWMSSGFRLKDLGKELGISSITLSTWRRKRKTLEQVALIPSDEQPPSQQPAFVELKPGSATVSHLYSVTFKLQLPSGAFIAGLSLSDIKALTAEDLQA